jgi:hypothetical protein
MKKVLILILSLALVTLLSSCNIYEKQQRDKYTIKNNVEWFDPDGIFKLKSMGYNNGLGTGEIKISDVYSSCYFVFTYFSQLRVIIANETDDNIIGFKMSTPRIHGKKDYTKIQLERSDITLNNVYYEKFSTILSRRDLNYEELEPQKYMNAIWRGLFSLDIIIYSSDDNPINYYTNFIGTLTFNDLTSQIVFNFLDNHQYEIKTISDELETIILTGSYHIDPTNYENMILSIDYDNIFNYLYDTITLTCT